MMRSLGLLTFVVSLCLANVLSAQEATTELTDKEQKELLKTHYRSFASRTAFKLNDGTDLKMSEPVYNWVGQEQAGFSSGDVFVWEHQGRAEIIGCIGSYANSRGRWLFQEYHTLTREPLKPVTLEVAGEWAPQKAGVEMKPVDTDLTPTSTGALRLAQMRRIAGKFQPFMMSGQEEERLRLQPSPLYRYQSKELEKTGGQIVDGGLFAYVWTIGTDPELLIALECHKTDDGLKWMYAPVRFTYRKMRLEYDGSEIWKCRSDNGSTMKTPYLTTTAGPVDFAKLAAAVEKQAVSE